MADVPTGQYIGQGPFAFTDEELARIAEADPSFYNALRAGALRNAFVYVQPLPLVTSVSAGATLQGIRHVLPWRAKAFLAEVGCEAAGGATAVGFIEVARAATPTTFTALTSVSNTDIKGVAPATAKVAIDATKATLEVGDVVRYAISSGAGGAVTGGFAQLYLVRL